MELTISIVAASLHLPDVLFDVTHELRYSARPLLREAIKADSLKLRAMIHLLLITLSSGPVNQELHQPECAPSEQMSETSVTEQRLTS